LEETVSGVLEKLFGVRSKGSFGLEAVLLCCSFDKQFTCLWAFAWILGIREVLGRKGSYLTVQKI